MTGEVEAKLAEITRVPTRLRHGIHPAICGSRAEASQPEAMRATPTRLKKRLTQSLCDVADIKGMGCNRACDACGHPATPKECRQ